MNQVGLALQAAARRGRVMIIAGLVATAMLAALLPMPAASASTTFTVNTVADHNDGTCAASPGDCTLREAINAFNGTSDATIGFAIAGAGPKVITLASELPELGQPGTVTATPPSGFEGPIRIDGNGVVATGLSARSAVTIRGLYVTNFTHRGIRLSNADNAVLEGNVVGLDEHGAPAGNTYGIQLEGANIRVGGTTPQARNVISANRSAGIWLIRATATRIKGNWIGTSLDGSGPPPGPQGQGIDISWHQTTSDTLIGGTEPGAGNVLSGNGYGVHATSAGSTGTVIQGNLIGLDATGSQPVRDKMGIGIAAAASSVTIGGAEPAAANTLSGLAIGIAGGTGGPLTVQGNRFGTTADGAGAVPSYEAMRLNGTVDAIVGGTAPGEANTFRNHVFQAIQVAGGTGNRILGNSIDGSGELGIDLALLGGGSFGFNGAGITPNDPLDADSTGGNGYQNFPVLTGSDGGEAQGTLNSAAGQQFRVEVFASPACNALGYGEGAALVGAADNVATDTDGNASFSIPLVGAPAGSHLTATATGPDGTSEFSECFAYTGSGSDPDDPPAETLVVNSAGDEDDGVCDISHCTLREAINATNAITGDDVQRRIHFDIGGGDLTIDAAGGMPAITEPVVIDATTQPGHASVPLVELTGPVGSGAGLFLAAGDSTVRGLVINGFTNPVMIHGHAGNRLKGNYLGTNRAGTQAVRSTEATIVVRNSSGNVIGGAQPAEGNVISGTGTGVQLDGLFGRITSGNVIQGNRLGLNAAGTAIVAPASNGAVPHFGVQLWGSGVTDNLVGGDAPGEGNVLAHGGYSVMFQGGASGNRVAGNRVGTNAAGTESLGGNHAVSIQDAPGNIIGGPTPAHGNLLATGVYIAHATSSGTIVRHNAIGTDFTGSLDLNPRNNRGVEVQFASDVTIADNVIAYSGLGVMVHAMTDRPANGVTITRNSISRHGTGGLRVSGGANDGLTYPDASAVTTDATSTTMTGTLTAAPNREYRLELFDNSTCSTYIPFTAWPSAFGFGEGETYLGFDTIQTDGSGVADFTATVAGAATGSVTATATDLVTGSTSEFSQCLAAGAAQPNTAPVTADDDYATEHATPLTIAVPGVLGNDSDDDGDALTAVLVDSPSSGTLNLAGDGSFVYTPASTFSGPVTFTYGASDGTATSNLATVTINVAPPPPAVSIDITPATQTVPAGGTPSWTVRVTNTGGQSLTGVSVQAPAASDCARNIGALAAGTVHAYVCARSGVTTGFTNVVTAMGTPVAGPSVTDSDDAVVTVQQAYTDRIAFGTNTAGTYDIWTVAPDGSDLRQVTSDAGAEQYPTWSPDGTRIAYVQGNTSLRIINADGSGTPQQIHSGSLVTSPEWSPDGTRIAFADRFGPVTEGSDIAVINVDGSGLVNLTSGMTVGGSKSSDIHPTWSPDGKQIALRRGFRDIVVVDATAPHNVSEVVTLGHSPLQLEWIPGSTMVSYMGQGGPGGAVDVTTGVVAPNSTGLATFGFSWSPAGTHVVRVNNAATQNALTVRPMLGGTETTVVGTGHRAYYPEWLKRRDGAHQTPVNAAPVAADDAYRTEIGTALTVATTRGLRANDSDADGDPLSVVVLSQPSHGTLTLPTSGGVPRGGFTYTPEPGFRGTDTFTYRAWDMRALSNVATVTITVGGNTPPVAVDDAYATDTDVPLVVPAAVGVLANDSDPDGDALTARLRVGATPGRVVLDSNGGFTYTPPAGYAGKATFLYQVSDGLEVAVGTVTITVGGPRVTVAPSGELPPVPQMVRVGLAGFPPRQSLTIMACPSAAETDYRNCARPVGRTTGTDGRFPPTSYFVDPFLDGTLPGGCTECVIKVLLAGGTEWGPSAPLRFAAEVTNPSTVTTESTAGGTALTGTIAAGQTVATGTTATTADPVVVAITSPNAGPVSVTPVAAGAVANYDVLGAVLSITAPPATLAREPLTLSFVVAPPPGVDPDTIDVSRNGAVLPRCASLFWVTQACVGYRTVLPDGQVRITVLTREASAWAVLAPTGPTTVTGWVAKLGDLVGSVGLNKGNAKSLTNILDAAAKEHGKAHDPQACRKVDAFTAKVAQLAANTKSGLSGSEAEALTAGAAALSRAVGCDAAGLLASDLNALVAEIAADASIAKNAGNPYVNRLRQAIKDLAKYELDHARARLDAYLATATKETTGKKPRVDATQLRIDVVEALRDGLRW